MPILSNLSRRFHMLTTDAKPDPPRIPISGYTHNLVSNTKNNDESKKTNYESVPVTKEAQFERNNAIQSEKEKSRLNNAVPIVGANCSSKKQDLNNTKSSPHSTKERIRPNVKTKTKMKQHKHSQGSCVVNYNIINSNGVKIGSRTSYICNINQFAKNNTETSGETWSKSKIRQQMPVEVKRLCASTNEITLNDIFIIKTYIGHGWKDVARKLLYSDGQIEQFEENYRFQGISEVIYQIFLDWKQANTKDADLGNLINILWECKEYDCAERLVSVHSN
ncbi:Receptor-interacting serine/threonine-protein kinase 1, partial [Eufriesea mexicana]